MNTHETSLLHTFNICFATCLFVLYIRCGGEEMHLSHPGVALALPISFMSIEP